MKGIFINPTNHLIIICPIINDQIGIRPKNAKVIKMKESNARAGIELKAFLIHKCLPAVTLLNHEKTIASKFSLIKKAIQLAAVIRGTKPNICCHAS